IVIHAQQKFGYEKLAGLLDFGKFRVLPRRSVAYERLSPVVEAEMTSGVDRDRKETVRHRYDKKHAFNLSYFPVENHAAEYFCDICLVEMLTSTSLSSSRAVTVLKITHTLISLSFKGLRVMGTAHGVKGFVQGLASDGNCTRCERALQYELIFKCSQCKNN
nr:zinc finger, PHD-type [Tanacetum cinerariifolium]